MIRPPHGYATVLKYDLTEALSKSFLSVFLRQNTDWDSFFGEMNY